MLLVDKKKGEKTTNKFQYFNYHKHGCLLRVNMKFKCEFFIKRYNSKCT